MDNENKNLSAFVNILEEKKAKDIRIIDISELTTIAHYFVIASGTSVTHIKSLADHLVDKLSENDIKPLRVEGYNSARWILLDYGDIVVHIFHEEDRDYYSLERLWQDGKFVESAKTSGNIDA
ncbi:MAG TPA: ribosome silencing factor [Clostridiaceae bacterium]|nr:ribosome silencing factor [Clostridiaceae bacterium]